MSEQPLFAPMVGLVAEPPKPETVQQESLDQKLFGKDLFGDSMAPQASGPLAQRFIMPPFSVLSARDGNWQDRKRSWLSLGIKSEVGRLSDIGNADGVCPGGSARPACDYSKKERGDGAGKPLVTDYVKGAVDVTKLEKTFKGTCGALSAGTSPDMAKRFGEAGTGTSIFDPVVCELAYRWWCAPGWQVVDPFSGGSVRGVVAAMLGLKYWGSDLREEQILANRQQALEICPDKQPTWVAGDSSLTLADAPMADLIFSCPPYFDLEVYSNDPRDLSAMEWSKFLDSYYDIIKKAVARLKPNRFACFVVGDFRDEKGFYRNFVSETIAAFNAAGAQYYNEGILVTAVGSLPVRVSGQFGSGRKLGKTHQNIIVGFKGDPKKIKTEFPEVSDY